MLVSLLRRSSALILAGMLLAGCASPLADWKPLSGQDGRQRERDWQACQPPLTWGEVGLIVLLAAFPGGSGYTRGPTLADHPATFGCMERAGYEWAGRPPSK